MEKPMWPIQYIPEDVYARVLARVLAENKKVLEELAKH